MNKNDLNRMLELIDDKYIQEAEPGKNRRLRWRVALLPVAAIICMSIILINVIMKDSRNSNYDDGGNNSGNVIESNNDVNSADDSNKNSEEVAEIDYKKYFNTAVEQIALDYTLEAGGASYSFESENAMYTELGITKLPFACDDYHVSATAFCDSEGNVENALIRLDGRSGYKNILITVSASGNLYSCFPLDEYGGMDRNGVTVYGYETLDEDNKLGLNLYFVSEGIGYNISSYGLEYNEAVAVMDGIIDSGIALDTFDLSLGVKHTSTREELTLEEAGKLETFRNLIPTTNIVEDMELENDKCYYYIDYEDDEPVYEGLDISYYNYDYDYITLAFGTNGAPYSQMNNVLEINSVTEENVSKHAYRSDINGNNWYSFVIEDKGIYIAVSANCTEQELWLLLDNLLKL